MVKLKVNGKEHSVDVRPATPLRDLPARAQSHPPRGRPEGEGRWQMTEIVNLSRRGFLRAGLAAGGGLLLGVHLSRLATPSASAEEKVKSFAPNAFVRIGTDDS